MKYEWKATLVSNDEWQPMMATSLKNVAVELAPKAAYYDVQCRNAETKEKVNWRNHARTNGGQVCDVSSGPCSCGAWH